MTVCIYCRKESGCPFAKPEHVMPRAFGTFEQNLTLHRVCGECNQAMGDELEVFFGRDSGEAFQRLVFGLKPEDEAHQIKGKRLEYRVREKGMFEGAYVTLSYDDERGVTVVILPQVAFRHPASDESVWLREHELTEESVAPYRRHTQSRVFGTIEDMTRVQQRLQDLGVQTGDSLFVENPDAANPELKITVEIIYTLDDIVLRTIAKIAFNYLAYVTRDMPHFCLREEFDVIRRYIRYGEQPRQPRVRPSAKQILFGDTHEYRITRGHVLNISWPEPRATVRGQVSLFNNITYNIQLSSHPPGVWWELIAGHHFDVATRTIDEISSANRILIQRP
jgi:hypothetical protein